MFVDQSEIKRLRKEFQRKGFHSSLPEHCGTECVNCHDGKDIEYHHIVPLEVGGTNEYSNIVPLCCTCHMSIHTMNFVKADRTNRARKKGGRKRLYPDGYQDIIHDYLFCKISKTECAERLGIKVAAMQTYACFKECVESLGIENHRNNIEIIKHKNHGEIRKGAGLGYVEYKDGRKIYFYSGDDGVIESQERRLTLW